MNTTQLKRFAAEARNKLREGVKGRLIRLGFDLKTGEVPENLRPVAVENAGVWRGKAVSNNFMYNWNELYNHIKQIGIKHMIEEGAYTWFNRLVAIRILAKNNLCDAVLQYVDSARTPRIVDEARTGRIPAMSDEQRQHLDELLDDDRLVTEQFAVLINAWVNNNPIISTCFDADSKHFMELLLPDDIRNENGFLDMLNSADFITDEDYRSPELIGWLYQFYISERKDEVFAKKGKYDADEIAPATQIFTPNWIVKYMVQNTVGRIYLDANPYEKRMAEGWKYLVEPSDSEKEQTPLKYGELEDLRVADLACGSGHILNECFDLLYELYIHEGYSRREAVTNIFEHNLTGIDIDLRAKQLATFALLLKACQRDSSFADAHCLPHVYDMPKVDRYTFRDTAGHFDCAYQIVLDYPNKVHEELDAAFTLMENADTLGSIMKFDISPKTREYLVKAVGCFHREPQYASSFRGLIDGYTIILALTEKYDAIVMNPPYMGAGNMPTTLADYVKKEYSEGRADLMTVFMQASMNLCKTNGYWAEINLPSWMFLPSFVELRDLLIQNQFIFSLIHLGRGIFGSDFGSVCFIIRNCKASSKGHYRKLIKAQGKVQSIPELQELYLNKSVGFYTANQHKFALIPGSPIAFWVSEHFIDEFNSNKKIREIGEAKKGLSTGDNNTFLRLWFEPSINSVIFEAENFNSDAKWFPINKGGNYRKWYGNNEYIINWANKGEDIKSFSGSVIRNEPYYLRESITWTMLSASCFGVRYSVRGKLFEGAGPSLFITNQTEMLYILGVLASGLGNMVIRILNPTVNININDVLNVPIKFAETNRIVDIVQSNINISRADWDAHETSWDFQENEIVGAALGGGTLLSPEVNDEDKSVLAPSDPALSSIESLTRLYKQKWEKLFFRLHDNEEELNRRFIEIYGLQDELTPDVPLNEVTILQQGEISIWKEGDPIPREVKNGSVEFSPIVWHDDVLMKQFISYAVGCMMGRYRLDRPGLAVAHPDANAEEIAPYLFNGEMFDIDDDAIIPLMPADCGFYDNATQRMSDFVRQVFGADTQTENLNYIERCLGKSIEQYFIKDFWKDHKKMYQNRPIYWLFSSKKGAFQVITYMHRMTPYTVERIRAKYLLPYIETLGSRIAELQSREDELSTAERKLLDSLQKQLEECREYHDRLAVVAERAIGFDLDDGVLHNYALYGDILAKLK